jgi:putative flippase GtrA
MTDHRATEPPATDHSAQLPQPVELPVDERESQLSLHAQLVRFVLTGGLSAVVDFGLLVLLMHGAFGVAGLGHTAAKSLSFIAGTTTAYLINRRWTFRAAPSRRRFLAVVVLYALTFALQVGLFSLLFTVLTAHGYSRLVVQVVGFVIAQGVATTVNFIVQRAVIFRLR